ncbi:MAG: oligoendopeptidase F, partial [Lachnospiraceae bacterium]|nr:oligoendopeptidase F [Lachnospiraceae bacterium]
MAKELPKRSEVKVEDTWDLTALFENEAAFDEAVKKVFEMVDELSAYEGKVCDTADNLLACEKLSDELTVLFERVYSYASKIYDTDTGDSSSLARLSKIKTM